jgi:inosine-uridine nucleoside N-ribohydrolase
VVLLTIGPLTNVGLLFSGNPEITHLLKGLVMMCGRYFDPPPKGYGANEWNAQVDAHATRIVFNAPVPVHRSIGLDVTHKVAMSRQEFRETFAGLRLFEPILEWAEIWFKDWPGTTFHDPLAAAVVFEPDLCSFRRGTVRVALEPEERYGATVWSPDDSAGTHEVAARVDAAKFFEHYLSVVKKSR